MNPSDAAMPPAPTEPHPLLAALQAQDGVLSATHVGSYCDDTPRAAISDLDTIVVCTRLSAAVHRACVETARRCDPARLGFPGHAVHINDTFGPLKFNTPQTLVIHLMVYDVAGHRQHVLDSPFTCHDWERSETRAGAALAAIYPVLRLQPRDFLGARRGLQDYLDDIAAGVITYRRYDFRGEPVQQVRETFPLDPRHRGEYACHIMRNLVANYAKLIAQQNARFDDDALLQAWRTHLPDCTAFIPLFQELTQRKRQRSDAFPADTLDCVRRFLQAFQASFEQHWQRAPLIRFYRHAPTAQNDGSFLGQGRDPGIRADATVVPLAPTAAPVYSSPLARAMQTAARLCPGSPIHAIPELAEIDYGRAEGLTRADLQRAHPQLIAAWQRHEDPPFPGGESTGDVEARLARFLATVRSRAGDAVVVTHNVVLRCLAGMLYGIPKHLWFKLQIPHGVPLAVRLYNGRFYPDFEPAVKAAITDGLVSP